jgi:serine/threonine protein kinase/sugar lactone lactonase YvrE
MVQISRYRIISRLGGGGMGEVYLAEDTTLGRRVALKVLPLHHTQDEERLRRFKQEARSASALNHPHILTIHEVGEADGYHFIATEYIDGETLRDLLKRSGRMKPIEALHIATQVASAVAAAHQAGIVHRDLKPENVMVRRDGYVKVLDFGLAKLTEPTAGRVADAEAETIARALHTQFGVVLGTAHYMSPEQAIGKAVDARSDIFAFGAMLYEMVSGQRTFQGASSVEILAAVINQDPKPLPEDIPPGLANAILRCLRKDPERRYQTMADLKVALDDLHEQSTAGDRQSLAASRLRRWTTMVAAATAGVVVIAVVAWQARRAPPDPTLLQAVALTTLPGVEQSPSLSPDGNYVVFAWTDPRQGNQDLYVQMIGSGSPLSLTTDPLDDYNPVWSPDGKWIAFLRSEPPAPTGVRARELRLKPPLGGAERKLADVRGQDFFPTTNYIAWSADSKFLIVTDAQGEGQPDALFVISIETGERRRLTNPSRSVFADTSPALAPDGRSLVFLRRSTWAAGELQLLPLADDLTAAGEPTRLTHATLRADFPAWMPDGSEIVFASRGSLWRQRAAQGSTPTRIGFVGDEGLMPAISRPQPGRPTRLVYVRSFVDTNFWRIETSGPGTPATSPPAPAISSTRHEYHGRFSPDGRRVAFTSTRSGDAEIWVSDPDGSNAVQLTSTRAQDTNCVNWSPDGQFVSYSSNGEGEFDVYVVAAAGGKPRRVTSDPAMDLNTSFSRDGRWLYFNSMRTGDYRLWKTPVDGGEAIQVTFAQATQGFETYDGRYLYHLTASIVSPLWRMPVAGGEPAKVLDGVIWFNFAMIENGAYYIDRVGTDSRLHYLDFATGKSTIVASNLGDVSSGLTASPDGRTILYSRVDSSVDDLMLVENFR